MNRSVLIVLAWGATLATTPAFAQTQVTAPNSGPVDGVFVEQIGTGNDAIFTQSANTQNAEVVQDGDDNAVDVTQSGDGGHFVGIDQSGDSNIASVAQSGAAQNVAILTQTGSANTAILSQNDTGFVGSGAGITQNGSGNLATLVQDGSANQAILAQNGDNNTLTATQLGDGNSLEWTQNGNGLPDIGIVQTGGATAIVTQGN